MADGPGTVGASLRGHAYHHAWAARSALALLEPGSDLDLVVVENFSVEDAPDLSDPAIEVADLVRYYGGRNADGARLVEIVQFKHSDAQANSAFRAADAAKTIKKFAAAFRDFEKKLGSARRNEILRFNLTTNRPIHVDLWDAVEALAQAGTGKDGVAGQMEALRKAAGLPANRVSPFFALLSLSGRQGNLRQMRQVVRGVIASWSEPSDLDSRHRLKEMLSLVEDAATNRAAQGHGIDMVDVLAALGVVQPSELYPAEAAFPAVQNAISRAALDDIIAKVTVSSLPLIVHATGGMGKTVLMQSLAERLGQDGLSVLFDGFGGGEWRNPSDARHRASRGLLQLVNQIAAKGLCDPILRGRGDPVDLLSAARERLRAAAAVLREQGLVSGLNLILDAIDHSAEQAAAVGEPSFAALLLKSLAISPIDGVRLIVSCRTERLPITRGDVECPDFVVPAFAPKEALQLIQAAHAEVSESDVATLMSRAQGNPRILAALLRQGPPFDPEAGPPPTPSQALNALLESQLRAARTNALMLGATAAQFEALLAGLALLPPPTPIEELAVTQGLPSAAVQSFVADMFPLLEATPTGVIFRDEPTEQYVRDLSRTDPAAQTRVLERLDQRQVISSYAARAYPVVLRALGLKAELYALALDDRIPASAGSDVARRAVRAARLDAALSLAAEQIDHDQLFTLSLETARLVGGHGRSARFIREHPDLIAVCGDAEARRRIFEDRTTWGGARHAARAVAAYFGGDPAEAHREARRALDWFNWWLQQRRRSAEASELPTLGDRDIEGPAFVMCRTGRAARMLAWLQSQEPALAFHHISGVVRLLERAAAASESEAHWRARAYGLLARRRATSPLVLLAILVNAPRLPSDVADTLAAAIVETDLSKLGPLADTGDRKPDLNRILVGMAAQEFAQKRPERARRLLEKVKLSRPSQYEFDPPSIGRGGLQDWLVYGLLRAASEGRPLDLRDIAPREVDALVVESEGRATAETYRAAVIKGLAEPGEIPPDDTPDRREARQDGLRRLERCVKDRLPALIAMLEALRPLIAIGNVGAMVQTAADLIRDKASKASNYPYSDQRQFLGNVLSGVASTLGRAAPGLDHASAVAMADVLATSPTHYLSQQVHWVRIFDLRPETASVATAFASAIADFMLKDGSLDSRLTKYAELAYALGSTSPEESAAYVRLALGTADGLSGDDYEESQGLISIAVHYEGAQLNQDVVFAFARLCEAQMPEDADRYAWREFSEALARIGGLDGLAVAARLEDRGKGGLEYNYLMLPAYLVERGKLAPELAVVFAGLKPYRDFYVFRLTDFLGKILPKLDAAKRELAFQFAAQEWDRESLSGLSRDLARLLADLASRWLPANDPLLARFKNLAGAGSDPTEKETLRSLRDGDDGAEILAIAERLDASTPDALDAALDAEGLKGDEPHLGTVLQKLGARFLTTSARLKFAQAVAGSNRIRLSEKLWGLTDHVQAWSVESLVFRNARRALAETLIVQHVETLMGSRWDGAYDFRRVLVVGGALPEHEAVALILRHVRPSQLPNRTAWLEMAAHLAPIVDPQRLGEGLIRYVTRAEGTLEPDAQGGAWAQDQAVSADEATVVAGTLWRALGAVRAEHRWRAAHAVRRLVTVGRTDVLAVLMTMIDRVDAAPHQSSETRFRFLDARLWLLVAVDRIAVDRPDIVRPFRDVLARIASNDDLPHVLMRELAGRSLGRLVAAFGAVEGELDLAAINRSPFEFAVSDYHGEGYYHPKPKDYVERDPPFHFDHDFDKSEVMGVARLFGAHRYETGDHIAGWVHRWEPSATNMWRTNAEDWNRSPVTESFVGHLAWHGLFLTVGDFLKTRPLVATDWRPDPLREFLDQELLVRRDSRWLADDTGLTPPDAYLSKRHRDHLPRRAILPRLVGLDNTESKQIVVNGGWNSQDDVEFWVRSAFVPSDHAEAAAAALAMSFSHDVWLPLESDIGDFHRDPGPFRPWLTAATDFTNHAGLDLEDPYASRDARSGVRPIDEVIRTFDLSPAAPFERRWTDPAGEVFLQTEVWGGRVGRGRHETERNGQRTYASVPHLRELCRIWNATLVVLTFSRIYIKERFDENAFPSRWAVSLLDADGCVRPLVRTNRTVRKCVAALDRETRREYDQIYAAVERAMEKPAYGKSQR